MYVLLASFNKGFTRLESYFMIVILVKSCSSLSSYYSIKTRLSFWSEESYRIVKIRKGNVKSANS